MDSMCSRAPMRAMRCSMLNKPKPRDWMISGANPRPSSSTLISITPSAASAVTETRMLRARVLHRVRDQLAHRMKDGLVPALVDGMPWPVTHELGLHAEALLGAREQPLDRFGKAQVVQHRWADARGELARAGHRVARERVGLRDERAQAGIGHARERALELQPAGVERLADVVVEQLTDARALGLLGLQELRGQLFELRHVLGDVFFARDVQRERAARLGP